MKTFKEILQEGVEGYPFRTCLENLSDEQILEDVETYAEQFKPKWISVEDQLPELAGDRVLLLEHKMIKNFPSVYIGRLDMVTNGNIGWVYETELGKVVYKTDNPDYLSITHWMPLIEAPIL